MTSQKYPKQKKQHEFLYDGNLGVLTKSKILNQIRYCKVLNFRGIRGYTFFAKINSCDQTYQYNVATP